MASSDPVITELATRFRAARRLAEVSVKDAAEQLGISPSTLERIEKGKKQLPAPYIAWAISEWKSPPWLLGTWLLSNPEQGPTDRGLPGRRMADLPGRRLADLAWTERDQGPGTVPEGPGAPESSGQ
jgi:transcriptional regulator with XRE-family HTH domain